LLLFAAFGLAVISGALGTRRNNAALDRDGIRVTGVVETHSVRPPGKRGRRLYMPNVRFHAEGQEYLAYGGRGTLKREPPVGTALDVVYLPGRPHVARVVGYEARSWKISVVVGSFLVEPSLGGLAFLGSRALFRTSPGKKQSMRTRLRRRRRSRERRLG
jgi:hypothetical protein